MRLHRLAALLLLGSPVISAAQGVDTTKVDAILARRGSAPAPGCALAVGRDGRVAYAKGYGLASIEHGVAIGPRTVFDIGSVSKQFTAASLLLLARDGTLSLDDDVRRWIPELPDLGHTTLRQLLHHTSGWRDYLDLMSFAGWDDRDHTTDRDALDALRRVRALNFPPDSAFRYSNTGYFLLSEVVRRAGGRGLDAVAATGLFAPLGMADTHYLTDAREVIPRKATGYARADSGRWTIAMSDWEQIGDGGVQTTVLDLLKWAAELDHPRVLGDSLVRLMETSGRLGDGTPTHYGFGLFVDQYRGVTRVEHGGSWAGYRASILRLPRVDVAVICNTGGADNPSALALRVADLWLDADGVPPAARPGAAFVARAVSAEGADALAAYAGTFTDGALALTRLAAVPGTLAIAQPATGRAVRALLPLGAGRFADTVSGIEYRVSASELTMLAPDVPPARLTRMPPAATLDAAALRAYAGRYASDEANVAWTVAVRDGRLTVVPPRGDPIPLTPLFRDGFAGPGRVRFLRDASGRVTALTVTTRGVQAMRFERR
ncbi:beta-lactamase [Gemmatirosa kalamazoonensis]|uniref:Beta-lactamase n=1 Tax=Gemmatirosa kalamazoonensis TaxID=861299 RepID=W0RGG2_9BACT|nr:serine hydrolase [Gemmatirosa kalamazoonensis]AHG88488.1 beta-lactamase [Gemmatirosa kalamazoonensis]